MVQADSQRVGCLLPEGYLGLEARYEIASPSGASLNLLGREAEGGALAVVHISHSLGEQACGYAQFADCLAARGFHVYAHDHRGHGLTRAPDALPGHFGGGAAAEKVLADMRAVQDFIAGRHTGLTVIFFGSGTGGLIALDFVLREPSRGAALALWNPPTLRTGIVERAVLAWERFRLGSDVPSRFMASAAPATPISAGSRRAIVALRDGLARRRKAATAHCRVPILVLSGDGRSPQRHHPIEALVRRLASMGFPDVTVRHALDHGMPDQAGAAVLEDWARTVLD